MDFKAGAANGAYYVNLHGLNPDYLADTDLKNWIRDAGLLFWQDQQNSLVQYTAGGSPACGEGSDDLYCPNVPGNPPNPSTPELKIAATPDIHLYGIVYQPRGAWTSLTAGSGYSGPLQIITGAFELWAGANLTLGVPKHPATITTVSLIE